VTVVGIVPAAGAGERLGAERPKAFVALGGRPLVDWAIRPLERLCDRVVVAVPAGFEEPPDRVRGGDSRSASVRNALAAAPEADVVVVHDAARPFAPDELFARCVDVLRERGADGAVAAARVADTIKEASGEGEVLRTLDRSALWAIQTPQAFGADLLRRALAVDEHTLAAATDDAALVEAAGGRVCVVEARAENFKVTTSGDLRRAETVLASERAR
jgi:2-C-methyl-D-erythritol 4-phosphate cytidylyltransferase